MTKIKLALASVGALLLPVAVLAVTGTTAPNEGSIGSLQQLIGYIENLVWMLFGLIAVVSFLMAGILLLTAGGQPEKIQAARSAFIWGVAGVVVGILAFSILSIVGGVMRV